jgi:transposase-like protein
MARKRTARRYTLEQKQEILRRVRSGERQNAIAKETGIPAVTIGYWVSRAKARGGVGRKPGARTIARATRSQDIVWALDGDVLVVRIPLRQFVRHLAQRALAKMI